MSLLSVDRGEADGLLAAIVEVAANADMHLSMTLVLPGGAIAGRVVSPSTWLQAQSDLFRGVANGESLSQAFASIRDELVAEESRQEECADDAQPPANFIYLLDGSLIGTPKMTGEVRQHFKVRRTDVSAWSFGEAL